MKAGILAVAAFVSLVPLAACIMEDVGDADDDIELMNHEAMLADDVVGAGGEVDLDDHALISESDEDVVEGDIGGGGVDAEPQQFGCSDYCQISCYNGRKTCWTRVREWWAFFGCVKKHAYTKAC